MELFFYVGIVEILSRDDARRKVLDFLGSGAFQFFHGGDYRVVAHLKRVLGDQRIDQAGFQIVQAIRGSNQTQPASLWCCGL